ncbi:MAG: FKBP-type peptidyl-prolyl cis-trans isomerase [Massilia sp.]|nr:FKBP-type peptidyl-prolyl cis-trans isomerase [Massilia sp.]
MKRTLPLIAAFVALLGLSACGGGASGTIVGVSVSSPATLSKIDTVPGTGAAAAVGSKITVNYTGWLYNSAASDFKGAKFDSNSAMTFTLASGSLIEGWVQGIPGMKVGGKRTLLIPSSLGYGASGSGASIPPNSGLVFDIELTAVN